MSKPSELEVQAKEFVRDNAGLVEHAGVLTLQTIARAGLLLSIELNAEVVELADLYTKALKEARAALTPEDLQPKKVAALEARIPELEADYQRKLDIAQGLNELTDRAIELYEGRTDDQVDEAWRQILDEDHLDEWHPEPRTPLEVDWMKTSTSRDRGFFAKLLGRK